MALKLDRALPYLSPPQSVDDTAPLFAYGADGPIFRPFSEGLRITYMLDEPGALVFVRERDVEEDRRGDLHALALENLRAHVQRRKLRFELKGPLYRARLDGQHDASLLLLDELWDPPTRIADVEGELVAAVPSRDTLSFTGTAAADGVAEVRAAIEREAGRALSREIFVRRRGAWAPFDG